jgi:hypothetical protein
MEIAFDFGKILFGRTGWAWAIPDHLGFAKASR